MYWTPSPSCTKPHSRHPWSTLITLHVLNNRFCSLCGGRPIMQFPPMPPSSTPSWARLAVQSSNALWLQDIPTLENGYIYPVDNQEWGDLLCNRATHLLLPKQERKQDSVWDIILHTPLETWFWFQWNLTIPYDQGWWERQYEVYLKQFYCKNPDLCFSQDFKRVLWKYKISSYTTAFYLIFWFFGTFYDDQSHFCDLKVQFSTQNI